MPAKAFTPPTKGKSIAPAQGWPYFGRPQPTDRDRVLAILRKIRHDIESRRVTDILFSLENDSMTIGVVDLRCSALDAISALVARIESLK